MVDAVAGVRSSIGGAAIRSRLRWVDRLRGWMLLLAASDHVWIVLFGVSGWWRIPARPAVYVLALLSGALFKADGHRRRLEVLGAGVAASLLGAGIGLQFPDVLLVFAVAHFLMILAVRRPLPWFVGALSVGLSFSFWGGYEVGVILAVMLVGHLAARLGALDGGDVGELGAVGRVVEWVGRHPLTFWLAHLATLLVWTVTS